jgi:hypothetical protein
VIPEAVSANSQGYLLVNNDPILWTMLNAIKEQQVELESLRTTVSTRSAFAFTMVSTDPAATARSCNGNVTTDSRGFAAVTLPNDFAVSSGDYRYQFDCGWPIRPRHCRPESRPQTVPDQNQQTECGSFLAGYRDAAR